jgi:PST family polysaccharide transporter
LAAGLPFGPIGVATTYTIAVFVMAVPALVYAGRPLGIGAKDVLRAVGPQTIAGLAAVAFGWILQRLFLSDFSLIARFFISATLCLAAYLAVVVAVFRVTGPLRLALSALRDFGPMRWRRIP